MSRRLLALLATRLAPALVLVALAASPAAAQSRIEGVVKALDGSPLAGATVIMEVPGIRKSASTVTDAEGRYAFADVKPGVRVHIIVSKNGQEVVDIYPLVSLWVEKIDIQERPVSAAATTSYDVLAQRGTGAEIDGVVRDARGLPVPAARVTINQTTLTATTDSAGRFAFSRIRTGIPIDLHVTASGYKPAELKIEKTTQTRIDHEFMLEPDAGLESAGAVLSPVDTTAEGSRTLLRPAQVAGISSLNRGDVFRGLQFLPGVAGGMESNGDLYVRGSGPGDTMISLDGFTLYPSSHALTTLGPLNAGIIKRAVFTEGVPSAWDGGHLSGSLRLTQQADVATGAGGYFDMSLLGPAGVFNIPAGDGGAIMVAARRSLMWSGYENLLDSYMPTTGTPARHRDLRYSGGMLNADPESGFWDINTKADFKLSARDRLSVSYYAAHDNFNNSQDLSLSAPTSILDPSTVTVNLPADPIVQQNDVQHWTSYGLGASWSRLWSSRAATRLTFGRSDQTRDTDRSSMLISQSTGADYAFQNFRGGSNASSDTNQVVDTTVRFESAVGLGSRHALAAGAEYSSVSTDYLWQREVFSAVRNGGPYTSTLTPVLIRNNSGNSLSFFVQDSGRPIPRLVISPGLRLSYFGLNSSWYLDPRVNGMFQLTPWMRIKGGLSVDHQMVNRLDREDQAQGDGQFWTVADGEVVQVPRSEQIFGGFTLDSGNIRFELNAYKKALEGLTLLAPRLVTGVAPTNVNSLFYHGTGTASGADVTIQHQNDINTLWLSYSYGLTEYQYPTLEAKAFPASFDRKNELKVADSIQVIPRLTLTGTWVAASGLPSSSAGTTPYPVWFPNGATVYQVTFGSKNADRLPAYHRLDVTAQYDFRMNRAKSSIGVSVYNIYNQQNIGGYRYQNVGNLLKVDTVYLMGRALNVFARIGF